MIIQCPYCKKDLELSEECLGWRVRCAYCDEEFRALEPSVRSGNGLSNDSDELLSVNWDALESDADERRKWNERATIWRERIQINCPECEAKLSLETRLLGGRVMCPHCGVAFLARGEGAMVTEDRNRYRDDLCREKDAESIRACLNWGSEAMTTLQIGFKLGGFGCEPESDGVYLRFWFEKNFDISNFLDHFKGLVESMIGYELQVVKAKKEVTSDGYVWEVRYRVQKNSSCKQISQSALERKHQAANDGPGIVEHPMVLRRKDEEDRLSYLVSDDVDERVYSRNYFSFIDYLRKKYGNVHVMRILVMNEPPTDSFCKLRGLKDGFGIIVETRPTDGMPELPDGMINDMEKRFSRKLTLVKKIDGDIVEYCFMLSDPGKTIASEKSNAMEQQMSPTRQPLGKGTGVDWSKENAAFARFADEYGISDFWVNGVNPYCMEVSIPLSVDEDDVRDFANDLFDALGLLSGGEIDFHQFGPYCFLDKSDDCYYVVFNHHSVVGSKAGDVGYKFTVEAVQEGGYEDDDEGSDGDITPEKVMQYIAAGIKSGAIRSKSGEGFFVLEGKYFDQIAAGEKTTEYRDISPRNLSKSIGIKTVKLQRGYKKVQMRYMVESVKLMDANGRECDPYNIPAGFIATRIAIHLGKRIA